MAVDFMQSFVEKNRQLNSHHVNIKFIQADVLKLGLPEKSFDIIFTNWLLMYMSDEEVQTFFINCLRWLKEDGYLFFRESCYHQSGNVKRTVNPTRYRSPLEYTGALHMAMVQSEKGIPGRFGYEITISKPVDTYIKYKSNYNQICWLAQKVHQSEPFSSSSKTFQEFLDQQQYSRNGILRYEKIFGRHFISTGGLDTTKEFVNMLELRPKQKVLDVGSGIGGSAFYMAKSYDVNVLGIDLSYNMVSIAWERMREIQDNRVKFLVADATKMSIPAESFDVVYSRDTILHIPDKAALFDRFITWLRPGGKLLISDYCCGDGKHSEEFKNYVKQRGYILYSIPEYGKILEKVGFVNVKAEDRTSLFIEVLSKELKKMETVKDEFLQAFAQTDYDDIVNGWKDKQVRCGQGDQKWGLFYAEKPVNH
ncbi:hypothetical protein LSH36_390g02124 [Paralvinella palmiformis]|uniref:phosphoethanolamine N-methyltransferase n=1 Tax=Paralvinella palmiformis TaxID=53620 RepID=A0AAD9N1H7_9ANNE|nr:hypothetical protein LSH36_390g02124 [Paralvinella palmiformis]